MVNVNLDQLYQVITQLQSTFDCLDNDKQDYSLPIYRFLQAVYENNSRI